MTVEPVPAVPPYCSWLSPGAISHHTELMSAGQYVPPVLGIPGLVDRVLGLTKPCRLRRSTTSTSAVPSVRLDQDTVWLVVRLVSVGPLTGPLITATGGVWKEPALVATAVP